MSKGSGAKESSEDWDEAGNLMCTMQTAAEAGLSRSRLCANVVTKYDVDGLGILKVLAPFTASASSFETMQRQLAMELQRKPWPMA